MKMQPMLVTASLALITSTYATSVAKSYDINFDERTVVPGVPELSPAGIEDGIFFNSWAVNEPSGVGVSTHSPPNNIGSPGTIQAVNGTPSLSIPAGSKIKSFDLSSFWFGCALNTVVGLAGKASQCTIDVAGFRKGQEVAVASFTFTPPVTDLSVPQIQGVLPDSFIALENVTIIQDDPVLNVLLADNFQVTTHS